MIWIDEPNQVAVPVGADNALSAEPRLMEEPSFEIEPWRLVRQRLDSPTFAGDPAGIGGPPESQANPRGLLGGDAGTLGNAYPPAGTTAAASPP